ncbi:has PEST characteristics, makes tube-like structures when expressed in bacteria, unstable when expressed in baculovirus, start codon in poor context so is poorly expressed if at all; putative [Helicoverpa armigera stunt virus]|uniref:Protein p17 n=1 Tax=Helicoverpa armigera stunt virus TaxID=37206 RepID=P17_HASV|nr:hypothetical protein HaSVsRNA-2gp1 [Helicoverpa armigera stunt virus]Q82461.1 RecName: Full=Protein p17 [Helicoverpa armigera stunt virus]AAC37884.1 has PEST characteristics, makes tube-like structures when expressed in bacteria, unstable when expressed in baculovirus, start codon in poor context so is poorly expressed if at all; putative [Helicoverpa armigera stunt virus]prf//2109362A 17kD PEST protein [Helicoverpa armigera stunt virus]
MSEHTIAHSITLPPGYTLALIPPEPEAGWEMLEWRHSDLTTVAEPVTFGSAPTPSPSMVEETNGVGPEGKFLPLTISPLLHKTSRKALTPTPSLSPLTSLACPNSGIGPRERSTSTPIPSAGTSSTLTQRVLQSLRAPSASTRRSLTASSSSPSTQR